MYVAKAKTLISYVVAAELICALLFAYAKKQDFLCRGSCSKHIVNTCNGKQYNMYAGVVLTQKTLRVCHTFMSWSYDLIRVMNSHHHVENSPYIVHNSPHLANTVVCRGVPTIILNNYSNGVTKVLATTGRLKWAECKSY